MNEARLKPREERRLLRGHKWVYRNEFDTPPEAADGELLDVVTDKGRFVGRGFYQASGGIAVRLLALERADVDADFFSRTVSMAHEFRQRLYPGGNVYRWIFGESDGLPGLVADRYGAVVVVQSGCAFYRSHAESLARAFLGYDGVDGVHVTIASETSAFGEVPSPVLCTIDAVHFELDPASDQKTGLFLDQRENWAILERFAAGADVFDGHCYTGAWSMLAARYGARSVLGVDTSRGAVERAERHASLNNIADVCTFACAEVQKTLQRGEQYDVVLLDPPALAKGRRPSGKALGLYQALNRDGMNAVRPGGILITSSCSQPIDQSAFLESLKRAANSARRQAQLLFTRGAAPDHPALLSMPETAYLTCAALRIL